MPISADEWARLRQDALAAPPDVSQDGVLLPYQRDLVAAVRQHDVVVYEKSRRIGATWGIGAQACLFAGAQRQAGGMDTMYIGYNLDMAREFVSVCAMWAKAFSLAAGEVGEFLFEDQEREGETRHIQAFRIAFASGFELVCLASRPRSLRGRQGFVIIDEAAFHDDLAAVLKAALAFLIWGGKVLVVSTHDGAENPFNEMILRVRAGREPYHLLRTDFDEAVTQGLFQRVCLVKGNTWSPKAEAEWRARIRAFYGDGAAEELDVIPRAGGSRYLTLALIEARARRDIPVLRFACDAAFVHQPEHIQEREVTRWCEAELGPRLRLLNPLLRSALGGDFGRFVDLSVFWPVQVLPDLRRETPFTVELRNVPFDAQRIILFYILDRLPRLSAVAMDGTGNGSYLAEKAMTARARGLEGNFIDIRHSASANEALPAGLTLTTPAMASGTLSPTADLGAALDALGDVWFTDIISNWSDVGVLAALESRLSSQFGPMQMRDCHAWAARPEATFSALASYGAARNSPHISIMGFRNSPTPPWEWAAVTGAVCIAALAIDPARPVQTLALPGLIAPVAASRFTWSERDLLLRDGISTFRVDDGGNVLIERVVTTYQTSPAGAEDISYLDVETMKTLAFLRYDLRQMVARRYPRHKLADDGTNFARGQAVATPGLIRAEIVARAIQWEAAGLVEGIEVFKRDIIVVRSTTDPNRVDALLPPDIVNQLRVVAAQIQFLL